MHSTSSRYRLAGRAVPVALLLATATATLAPAPPVMADARPTFTAADPQSAADKPTIVLVHGAWADASSWNPVISRLEKAGYPVVAPPNPLRGVAADAETIADFVATIPGPVVLVGHSYGGMVITNAATKTPNVRALVYDDAYIPDQGDTVFAINAAQPGSCVTAAPTTFLNLVPYPGGPAGDVDAYLKYAPNGQYQGFDQCFANRVPAARSRLLAAGQRPFAVSAGTEPSGPPAWKTLPSWAVVGTQDHVIPPTEQLFMAHRAGSHVVQVPAGHLSLLTDPDTVAHTITEAAKAVG
ncbi:alpha/beta hydrolase [Kitasatospora acidiphila]|uniref:Alpha/beta hydrolase n=1 Tax=Kitasatospora acidiphila TaxID=2567942 RepID=A0A540VY40_9ACTN|nr:alpha/beta hydrolase [Kitasatospora acidiphila]TQF01647.1 alpha/beta hydrolase [Kitasatospora acidiphila]